MSAAPYTFAGLLAYRAAPTAERRAMIEAHYARLAAERIARYDFRRGEGAALRHHAEALARPDVASPAVATPRPWDRQGFWEYGR